MEITDIYVHDGRLLRIIEDTEQARLTMEVELPKDEWSDELVARRLVFDDAYGYQVFEIPFHGCPTILDIQIVGEQGRWRRVRLDTNAGYREVHCKGVRVLEREGVS